MVVSNFLCAVACTGQGSGPARRTSRGGAEGGSGYSSDELQVPTSLRSCAPRWLRHGESKRRCGDWRWL